MLRIPDLNFSHSGSASKNLSIFNPKKWFQALEIMIQLFIPDSDHDFLPIPDPGVTKAPDPGSATLHSGVNEGIGLFLPI